jgi:hypothetical protein
MIDKAITHRVETSLAEYDDATQDFDLWQTCSCTICRGCRVRSAGPSANRGARHATSRSRPRRGVLGELESLDTVRDEAGQPYGDRLLSLVMLNVLDEVEGPSVRSRSAPERDSLSVVGPEGSPRGVQAEAYTMFVDLMNDIYNTCSERFLKVQLILDRRCRRR